jgi:hypothetical protein
VHYLVHKSSPPVPILSQTNPVHTTPHHLIFTKSILMLSTHLLLNLPSDIFPSSFPISNLCAVLFSPIPDTCPAHLILNLVILIILDEEYKSHSSSSCFFLPLPPPTLHPFSAQIFFQHPILKHPQPKS